MHTLCIVCRPVEREAAYFTRYRKEEEEEEEEGGRREEGEGRKEEGRSSAGGLESACTVSEKRGSKNNSKDDMREKWKRGQSVCRVYRAFFIRENYYTHHKA